MVAGIPHDMSTRRYQIDMKFHAAVRQLRSHLLLVSHSIIYHREVAAESGGIELR